MLLNHRVVLQIFHAKETPVSFPCPILGGSTVWHSEDHRFQRHTSCFLNQMEVPTIYKASIRAM